MNNNWDFKNRLGNEVNDDDLDFSLSSNSRHDIEKNRLENLTKKSTLKPFEVFELIKNGFLLEKLIPMALEIIEKRTFVDFEETQDDEYTILDINAAYFSRHEAEKNKYEKLKHWIKNRGNCVSPMTGKPRKSYCSESEAREEGNYMLDSYGAQSPYQCEQCGEWHLTPSARYTPSKTCEHCSDGNGDKKEIYLSKDAAFKRAKIISDKRGIYLIVYKCPSQEGWHLTKGNA